VKRNLAPTVADILFIVVAPLTAITRTVKLTHSDGDLAAHIRMGQVILETRELPRHSLSSLTASNEPLVAHAWLSEVFFAGLFSIGGLALISVAAGILVGFTHAGVAQFLRTRGVDPRWALAAAFISLAVSSTHWLARPHMFSILGVALTIFLLESRPKHRVPLFALLFLLWANLHGGWIYGLVLIGAYVVGNAIEMRASPSERGRWRSAIRADALALAAAAGASLVNPYGWTLHREVFSAATSSDLARQMAEFLPPDFQTLAPLPFLLALLLTVALLATAERRMSAPRLIVLLVSVFFALRSFRNMALFGVSGWPLVALHISASWPPGRRPFRWFSEIARLDRSGRTGLYAVPVALALLVLGINGGSAANVRLIRNSFSPAHFPVLAVSRARAANLDGPVFEAWEWGGYIMNAWPDARLVVDPLEFNAATVRAFSEIDAVRPGWKDEMRRWNVRTVIIRPDSRLALTLEKDPEWKVWYRDSISAVFRPATD
jgi:hypothetical protein